MAVHARLISIDRNIAVDGFPPRQRNGVIVPYMYEVFQRMGIPRERTFIVADHWFGNARPTKQNIQLAICGLASTTGPSDTVFIYIQGDTNTTRLNNEPRGVLYDADGRVILDTEIRTWVRIAAQNSQRRIVLLLDIPNARTFYQEKYYYEYLQLSRQRTTPYQQTISPESPSDPTIVSMAGARVFYVMPYWNEEMWPATIPHAKEYPESAQVAPRLITPLVYTLYHFNFSQFVADSRAIIQLGWSQQDYQNGTSNGWLCSWTDFMMRLRQSYFNSPIIVTGDNRQIVQWDIALGMPHLQFANVDTSERPPLPNVAPYSRWAGSFYLFSRIVRFIGSIFPYPYTSD